MDKKTGIFYGTTTGATAESAQLIGKALGVDAADIHNIADCAPSDVANYDFLIFGSSTWGSGELQDDWYDFIAGLETLDLNGKIVALFGNGDESMSDTFCNAVGIIYDRLQPTGATVIGAFPATPYSYEHTEAEKNGRVVGLLLDDVNHSDLSEDRINRWAQQLEAELAQ